MRHINQRIKSDGQSSKKIIFRHWDGGIYLQKTARSIFSNTFTSRNVQFSIGIGKTGNLSNSREKHPSRGIQQKADKLIQKLFRKYQVVLATWWTGVFPPISQKCVSLHKRPSPLTNDFGVPSPQSLSPHPPLVKPIISN